MRYANVWKSGIVILSAGVAFLIINACLSYSDYNLYTGGKWDSSKTKLKKGVVAAWAMMFTNTALRGGELGLNSWLGHQELLLKQAVPAKKLAFSYRPYGVPFSFIIHKTDSISTGLFFYPHGKQKMIFYHADDRGGFILKKHIPLPDKESGERQVEILFGEDSFRVFQDKVWLATLPFAMPTEIRPGFRGSSMGKKIYIDNILITSPDNKIVFSENFRFPFRFYAWSWSYLFIWLIILCYCLYYDWLTAYLVYVCFILTATIGVCGYYYYFIWENYTSNPVNINWRSMKSTIETQDEVATRLDASYPVDNIAGRKKIVLFVGSSQTWGAGASDPERTFAAIVEDSLRSYFKDTNIIVINGGVSGIASDSMYLMYVRKLAGYKPVLTVLNAANNDYDTATFRKNLQAFADYDHHHGIASLWIEEPNDGIMKPNAKHMTMRSVARANNIMSVEMQPYMEQHSEKGFLWWDGVHLTDYGQLVFAEKLFPLIAGKLTEDSSASHSSKQP